MFITLSISCQVFEILQPGCEGELSKEVVEALPLDRFQQVQDFVFGVAEDEK